MRWARTWYATTAAVTLAALVTQLTISVAEVPGRGFVPDPAATGTLGRRVVSFSSFFTIQSDILVLVAAIALAIAPARGEYWLRWVRLAGLIGITVTFLVNVIVLRPLTANRYEGVWVVTDLALHYLTPALAIVGWLWFGPRRRFWPRLVADVLVWPALWVVWTFIRGAIIGWYPYPFLDVARHGYAFALAGVAIVTVLGVGLGALFVWVDRRLPPSPGTADVAGHGRA